MDKIDLIIEYCKEYTDKVVQICFDDDTNEDRTNELISYYEKDLRKELEDLLER